MKNKRMSIGQAFFKAKRDRQLLEFIENTNNVWGLVFDYAMEVHEAMKEGSDAAEIAKRQFMDDIKMALKSKRSRGMKRLFIQSKITFRDFICVILRKLGFSYRDIAEFFAIKHHNTVRDIILRTANKLNLSSD
jgi:hypothetical protein